MVIVETTLNIYQILLPFSSLAFAIAVVVLFPLAAWHKTSTLPSKKTVVPGATRLNDLRQTIYFKPVPGS